MATNLTLRPVETEAGEEGEEEGVPTELICMNCMEPLKTGVDVALLQLVEPWQSPTDGQVHYLVLRDDDDEPLLEPIFFEIDCYEELEETVREQVEEHRPIQEPHNCLECDFCGDSIRMGERCVAIDIGEIAFSPRVPETTTFVPAEGDLWVACLSCAGKFVFEAGIKAAELEQALSQNGECSDCTESKCWRHGRCICLCHRRFG